MRPIATVGIALSVLIAAQATPALADEMQRGWMKGFATSPAFKLGAHFDIFPTEMVVTDGYKLPPKVDSGLIQQLRQARMSLPNWHGMHGLAPGVGTSGK